MIKISPTRISCYVSCPLKYYFRYEKKIPIVPKIHFFYGTMVHKMAEADFRNKIETGELTSKETVQENFKKFWKEGDTDRHGTTKHTVEKLLKVDKTDPLKLKKSIYRCVENFREQLAPNIKPISVEEDLGFEYDGIKIECYSDIITADEEVTDLKTASKAYNEKEIEQNKALNFYILGYKDKHDTWLKYKVLNVLIKDSDRIQIFSKKIDSKTLDITLREMRVIGKAIENGIFFKKEQKWAGDLTCNYCEYRETCGKWDGKIENI